MKNKKMLSILLAMCMLLSVTPMSFAADNSTQENAIPVTLGEKISFTAEGYTEYWYSVETTKPGQLIIVESNHDHVGIYGPDGHDIDGFYWYPTDGYVGYAVTDYAGKYGIRVYHYNSTPRDYVMTVTLADNDAYEPNNTEETAYELTSGAPVEFQLGCGDYDYFSIETSKDGQDVQIDFSGFNYTTTGSFYADFDDADIGTIRGNGTYYLHAANAGKHIIELHNSTKYIEQYTMTATVLDGDTNEPNDTLEQATRLPIGTDKTFSMGGEGDEDWFTFESAFDEGADSQMYTLNLLDLNTDYSDEFYYDLYAPDGTKLMSGMEVNIRHANVIACEQEGLYALRLYRTSNSSPRSDLRIRVDEGGADPYESNDTWLTAAEVQTEQPIQFILSNTEDVDWFKFEVPEAYMTMHLNDVSSVEFELYSAEELEEFGEDEHLTYHDEYDEPDYYYQFKAPGTYYLKITSDLSHISQSLRTLVVSLEEATDEEPINTWKTATPIYEGVPMEYDLTAWNDYDWFVFEIPENVKQLKLHTYPSGWCELYRGADFEAAGNNAAYVDYGVAVILDTPSAGTYYLRCSTHSRPDNHTEHRCLNETVTYHLVMEDLPAQSMEDAEPIPEGQWIEGVYGGYYALGALKAGDQLHLYGENINSVYLYDAVGVQPQSYSLGPYQNCYGVISADGEYWLRVNPYTIYNSDDSYKPYRLLYDIADRTLNSGEAFSIEGPDIVTVVVGETEEVDLRLAPYDVKIYTDYTNNRLLIDDSPANTAVAKASSSYDRGFTVTGKAVGSTTVKYYLDGHINSVYKTVTINVVDPTAAQSIAIEGAPTELPLGTSATLQATLTPADSTDSITWTSSDPAVLYVSSSGKVTAVGDGSATITATATSGVSDSVTITVTEAPAKPEVTGLTLDDYDLTLYMGEGDGQLTATVSPAGSPVTVGWVSSNLKAATVDQTGKITPVGPGVTVITASAGDYRASCIVTVQAERVRVENIAFDTAVLEIPLGGESALRPNFTPSNATVKSMTWASTDTNVATVSRTGIVNALAVGETTVTATTLDGGKQASIIIRVIAAPQPGDINGDGYVDAADAMITLQVAVGLVELTDAEFEAADVNHDGWVDAADAVRILRYQVGLIDSLDN